MGDGETSSLEVVEYLLAYVYFVVNSSRMRLTTCRLEDRHALKWSHSTLASQTRVVVRV